MGSPRSLFTAALQSPADFVHTPSNVDALLDPPGGGLPVRSFGAPAFTTMASASVIVDPAQGSMGGANLLRTSPSAPILAQSRGKVSSSLCLSPPAPRRVRTDLSSPTWDEAPHAVLAGASKEELLPIRGLYRGRPVFVPNFQIDERMRDELRARHRRAQQAVRMDLATLGGGSFDASKIPALMGHTGYRAATNGHVHRRACTPSAGSSRGVQTLSTPAADRGGGRPSTRAGTTARRGAAYTMPKFTRPLKPLIVAAPGSDPPVLVKSCFARPKTAGPETKAGAVSLPGSTTEVSLRKGHTAALIREARTALSSAGYQGCGLHGKKRHRLGGANRAWNRHVVCEV